MVPTLITSNAETIRTLAGDERIDRDFAGGSLPRHVLRALSYKGVPFPAYDHAQQSGQAGTP